MFPFPRLFAVVLLSSLMHALPETGPAPGTRFQPNLELEQWIYRAEVFGQKQTALTALRNLLSEGDLPRREVIRAIGVVNAGIDLDNDRGLDAAHAETLLRQTAGTAAFRDRHFALINGRWRLLGDWVGPYLIVAIEPEELVVEHAGGYERRFNLTLTQPLEDNRRNRYLALDGARLGDVLAFICDRERLNSYIPSDINTHISGVYIVADWWTLLDQIAANHNIQWTRHLDNLVFQTKNKNQEPAQPLIGIYGKNKNLGALFQTIAENFGMELVLDEEFADVEVDIHNEEQPWNEVLDCLALMNGFQWVLTENRGHRRLVIQKER